MEKNPQIRKPVSYLLIPARHTVQTTVKQAGPYGIEASQLLLSFLGSAERTLCRLAESLRDGFEEGLHDLGVELAARKPDEL